MAGSTGRQAKPIQLQLIQGNPNRLTKKEIKRRLDNEIRFGDQNFTPSVYLKKNKIAYDKWKELIDLYIAGNIEFVSTADAGLIERYCFTHAEYIELLQAKDKIMTMKVPAPTKKNSKAQKKITFSQAITKIHKDGIESAINKKLALLLNMDCQLILTPLSKLKNVGRKTNDPDTDPLGEAGFKDI